MLKFDFLWGSAADPAGGAHNAPPDPLAGIKGSTSKGGEGRGRERGGEGKWGSKGGGVHLTHFAGVTLAALYYNCGSFE